MVSINPLYLIAVFLGSAFLLPIIEKGGRTFSRIVISAVLVFAAAVPVSWFLQLAAAQSGPVVFQTAGFRAPFSINLQVGIEESLFLMIINIAALLGGIYFMLRKELDWKGKSPILFLMMLLGVNGLVLTRDLFNVFVFLEITSIAVYALISFARGRKAYEAGFKYMVAGGIASSLFLIGVIFLYRLTGTLNIDGMIAYASASVGGTGAIAGKAGLTALFLVLAALIVELKPFPANGWGADAYEASAPGVSAMASAVSATGVLFVLYKVLPIAGEELYGFVAASGAVTFFFSQLLAMKQRKVRRMLGYSSIGQIGLLVMIAGLSPLLNNAPNLQGVFSFLGPYGNGIFPLLILFTLNHVFSKAGLFWISGILGNQLTDHSDTPENLRRKSGVRGITGVLVSALAGLPPFPAFWAKFLLIGALVYHGKLVLAAVILAASLIEAWYLLRWFIQLIKNRKDSGDIHDEIIPNDFDMPAASVKAESQPTLSAADMHMSGKASLFSPVIAAILLTAGGVTAALTLLSGSGTGGGSEYVLLLPLAALAGFTVLDLIRVPVKIQVLIGIAAVAVYGILIIPNLEGIELVFGLLFVGGSAYQMFSLMNRSGRHPGLIGMLTAMTISLGNLMLFDSSLGFFLTWEIMTVSSFFLITRGKNASGASLRYILFSLAGAFLILMGLAISGSAEFSVAAFSSAQNGTLAVILLGLGFLIKMGSLGLHIWLPGSYAEADDDISTFFSTVLSKAGLFMLFMTAMLFSAELIPGSGEISGAASGNALTALFTGVSLASLLGWIGAITALAGAFLALFKEDIKYTLAYSSMGQVGYMLLSFALMSQLGWMNSMYLAVTHLFYKGMLFVAIAGVLSRTKTRMMYQMGGLISRMPVSFFTVLIAIIALSGVPPLTGFGAKWMLYSALIEKGWYLQAGVAMFASGVAFLYLFRLIHTIFLGQLKDEFREVKEASIWYLIPQFVGIIGIMLISMYPNLLLKLLQQAIAPYFSGDIVWEGYTVISTLGYWNGNAVMYVTMGVFMIPLIWMLIVQRKHTQKVGQFNIVFASERPHTPETTHYAYNFFSHYRKALGFLDSAGVIRFWKWIGLAVEAVGGSVRKLYSGNVQTYALLIIMYISVVLLMLRGGF